MTVPVNEMSMLTLLHGARTSGSLAAALGIEGGAQEQRLVGGLHENAVRMADELDEAIKITNPVRRLQQSESEVVASANDAQYQAAHCIVATPPSAWTSIEFAPGLPEAHQQLPRVMPLGSVVKLQLVYPRPFWRDGGLSGLVIDDTGPFAFMVDNSPPDRPEGVLVTFLSAGEARRYSDRKLGSDAVDIRRRMFAEHVQNVFGASTPEPIDYYDRDWASVPWVGGGYSGVMAPGGWLSTGAALRQPVGRLHWASAESARVWNGYVEGAIEAGERAARDVIEQLDR
jgi:monoamine oxidase